MSLKDNLGREVGGSNSATIEKAIKSASTVYVGDFVQLDVGRVHADSVAGVRLLGQVVAVKSNDLDRAYTDNATGNAGGTVKALVNVEREDRYLLKSDNVGTTLAVTHEGTYFDLTGNPGSQLVDSSTTGATGQLRLVKFNPGIRGTDDTYGIYTIAEPQHTL